MKILIVDDTTFMRATIRQMLEQEGQHTLYEAENGLEAVQKYKLFKPDLVLMDISMPAMDGIEAVEHIRRLDPTADILMCSLQGQRASVMKAIQAGARGFLLKPLKAEKLYQELDTSRKLLQSKAKATPIGEGQPEWPTDLATDLDALIAKTYQDLEGIHLDLLQKNPSEDYLKGVQQGYLEARKEIAMNMLRLSLSIEVIKQCVEISDEELEAFRRAYRL